MSEALGKPDVLKREVAIVDFLRMSANGGETAGEIYRAVSGSLGDNISRPAYYKLLNRLEAAGQIEQVEGDGPRRYVVTPQIHSANPLTLDDVYEMLPFVQNTEAMARAIEAQQYFLERRDTAVRQAAEALADEPAVDLFHRWIVDMVEMLRADLESWTTVEQEGPYVGQAVLADPILDNRLREQCDELRRLLYRLLSVPRVAVDIPAWEGPRGLKDSHNIECDEDALRAVLETRVFGVGEKKTVLGLITVEPALRESARQEMIVSGSDGSFHAGTLGIGPAQNYIEDESFVVTINNSAAYIRSSERMREQRGDKEFLYTAPLTRQTLDDPAYKGMILAPFMFPSLTESEYEHMARAATDVVQMRVDTEVFNGTAKDVATGELIVPPRVHIRDGTITPQERGYNHYCEQSPYGDVAREGVRLLRDILQRIEVARGTRRAYVGAVKSTQVKLFSRLLNWYIAKGSRATLGAPIDPNWDLTRASYISDTNAMTELFASLPPRTERDGFWVSCVVLRQFASLTEFFDTPVSEDRTWFDILRERRESALNAYEKYRGVLPYHAMLSEDDLADDAYLYLLDNADYASFYVGHTAGRPAPKLPRYEFLCSLRGLSADEANERASSAMRQIVTALLTCGFTQDRDHNFLSRIHLIRYLPYVVHRAHEFAKHLGKKLEQEYKSAVVSKLAARRGRVIDDRDAELRPVGVRRYLRRYIEARRDLPPSEQDDADR
jgi:Fe2+ or Zn2+ uptake regulation protein